MVFESKYFLKNIIFDEKTVIFASPHFFMIDSGESPAFEHLRASFSNFPYNQPQTACRPAFKTLLNFVQVEKLWVLRTKQIFANPPKYVCDFFLYIFQVFLSKVTITYIFHHFHYFEPFCASFYIFPYNWHWTARLPAFKTLLNSDQLEKIRFLRTKQIFYSPE